MSNKVEPVRYGHQGDVLFKPALTMTQEYLKVTGFKPVEPVLAYGEVTGHSHRIHPEDQGRVRFFRKDDSQFLVVDNGGARLIHEEHATVNFAPGIYEINIQREQSLQSVTEWYRTQD